jgi:hypothetical protein
MSAAMQPMYGGVAALPTCARVIRRVKQHQGFGGAIVGDGMPQIGPAVDEKAAFIADLDSYVIDNLNGRTPSTSTPIYKVGTPLSLWAGFGSLAAEGSFPFSVIVSGAITGSNGRFNASANENGNWYESDSPYNIILSAPRNAFGCYVMDVGDFGATLRFDLYSGGVVVDSYTCPTDDLNRPSSDQAMWISYSNGSITFDRIRAVLTQASGDPDFSDIMGFDDFIVGMVPPCIPPT